MIEYTKIEAVQPKSLIVPPPAQLVCSQRACKKERWPCSRSTSTLLPGFVVGTDFRHSGPAVCPAQPYGLRGLSR